MWDGPVANAYLSAVYFKEAARNHQVQMAILWPMKQTEHVLRRHCVNTIFAVLSFAIELAAHCMRFTRSRLTICKACGHTTLKNSFNQRLCGVLINQFVAARVIKSIIKAEFVVLQKLGQIDFCFRLVNNQLVFIRNRYDIELFLHHLFSADWTLTHAHCNLMVFNGLTIGQWSEFNLTLELTTNDDKSH